MALILSSRLWTVVGSLMCAAAVGLGAYGWHGLTGDEAERDVFMLAVQYHMWHGLAVLFVAWRLDVVGRSENGRAGRVAAAAALAFSAGILAFSGSLYVFAVDGDLLLAGAAPFGGFAFMAGWLLLLTSALVPGS